MTIRKLIEGIQEGRIRVPRFQRGFVWEPQQVAYFIDSLYKEYPVGALLLWRTKEALTSEKALGPFDLPERDPAYPIDYVLDGQQRLSSVYGVFQAGLPTKPGVNWLPIFFDTETEQDIQESAFVALQPSEAEAAGRRYFPLSKLFDPVAYRQATRDLPEPSVIELDLLLRKFQEADIPVELTEPNDRATIAIIFERINRLGVPLDTLQLLSAWTWSEEFDLHREFSDLSEELEPFGFGAVGEDANLLLRCCSAIIASDAAPKALISLNGSDVRDRFGMVTNGIKGAIDFLRVNLNVAKLHNLPYSTCLVPLCVFFAIDGNTMMHPTNNQRAQILRWFWRTCFSKRYSSGVLRNLKADIEQMKALRENKETTLGEFRTEVDETFFLDNEFRLTNVNTKTFVLMLAQNKPRQFISGQPVALGDVLRDYNRSEFHHLYPKAFLKVRSIEPQLQNALANFTFLSKSENTALDGGAPSAYKAEMPEDYESIISSSLCPESLFNDDYESFLVDRSKALSEFARNLVGK